MATEIFNNNDLRKIIFEYRPRLVMYKDSDNIPMDQFVEIVTHPLYRGTINTTVDSASKSGHLETVEYLFGIGAECTRLAMYVASANGHLNVVKFLLSVGKGYDVDAIDWAARNGHLKTVEFLHSAGIECSNHYIMDDTITNGHVEVAEFLHSIGKKCKGSWAENDTIKNGRLNMIKFLHSIGTIFTLYEMELAKYHGHPEATAFISSIMI